MFRNNPRQLKFDSFSFVVSERGRRVRKGQNGVAVNHIFKRENKHETKRAVQYPNTVAAILTGPARKASFSKLSSHLSSLCDGENYFSMLIYRIS